MREKEANKKKKLYKMEKISEIAKRALQGALVGITVVANKCICMCYFRKLRRPVAGPK